MTTRENEITAADAQEAIRALRSGDDSAAGNWLEEMRHLLARTAAGILHERTESEDIAQTALLTLVNYMRDVPVELGNPPGLACTIARNLCIARIRSRSRRKPPISLSCLVLDDGTEVELTSEVAPPDVQFEQSEMDRILKEAVRSLEPSHRQVLRGLYWDGLTKQSIASELRISVRTVHNIRERALALLTRRLRKIRLSGFPASGVSRGEESSGRGGHDD